MPFSKLGPSDHLEFQYWLDIELVITLIDNFNIHNSTYKIKLNKICNNSVNDEKNKKHGVDRPLNL